MSAQSSAVNRKISASWCACGENVWVKRSERQQARVCNWSEWSMEVVNASWDSWGWRKQAVFAWVGGPGRGGEVPYPGGISS